MTSYNAPKTAEDRGEPLVSHPEFGALGRPKPKTIILEIVKKSTGNFDRKYTDFRYLKMYDKNL